MNKKKFLFLLTYIVLLFCLGFLSGSLVTVVPFDSIIEMRFTKIEQSIIKYYEDTGRIPSSYLDVVDIGYLEHEDLYDPWGNIINISLCEDGRICLISKGDMSLQQNENMFSNLIIYSFPLISKQIESP